MRKAKLSLTIDAFESYVKWRQIIERAKMKSRLINWLRSINPAAFAKQKRLIICRTIAVNNTIDLLGELNEGSAETLTNAQNNCDPWAFLTMQSKLCLSFDKILLSSARYECFAFIQSQVWFASPTKLGSVSRIRDSKFEFKMKTEGKHLSQAVLPLLMSNQCLRFSSKRNLCSPQLSLLCCYNSGENSFADISSPGFSSRESRNKLWT